MTAQPTDEPRFRRILIATRAFAPDPGAAARRWVNWVRALAMVSESVEVLTTISRHAERTDLPPNVRVARWPALRAKDGTIRGYAQYMSFDGPLFFRMLFAPRPDVVLCEPPPTTGAVTRVVCAMRRIPYVYSASDLLAPAAEAQGYPAPVVWILKHLERFALSGAQEVIAVSQSVADAVEATSRRTAVVLPHAVDVKAPLEAVAASTGPDQGPVFLYSGTATDWMGADVFVDAAPLVLAAIPDARFHFMGFGSGWDRIKDKVQHLADARVCIVPPCSGYEARVREANATTTMAALRPGPYAYAYTTKVLTSLAAGTPVVYAGVGPAAEDIRDNELGRVVPLEPRRVADALIEVAGAVKAGEAWVAPERLRAWVGKNHDQEHSGRCVVEICARAVGRFRRRATRP